MLFEVRRARACARSRRGWSSEGLRARHGRQARRRRDCAERPRSCTRASTGSRPRSRRGRSSIDRVPRVATWEVVIPEGLTAAEIGARFAERGLVDAGEFAAAVPDPELARSLGIPARRSRGTSSPDLSTPARRDRQSRAGARSRRPVHAAWRRSSRARRAWPRDARGRILASIVEKETGRADERPMIASVFADRLRRKTCASSRIPPLSTASRLQSRSPPQRSRRHREPLQHLPALRAASRPDRESGLDALRATIEPTKSEMLYFVSRNDGTHEFSSNYREHMDAVESLPAPEGLALSDPAGPASYYGERIPAQFNRAPRAAGGARRRRTPRLRRRWRGRRDDPRRRGGPRRRHVLLEHPQRPDRPRASAPPTADS